MEGPVVVHLTNDVEGVALRAFGNAKGGYRLV